MKAELEEKTIVIGEKLSLRRFEKLTGDCVASYVHGGGRIGVLVAAKGASGDAVKEALTNIAMQIAAMNPQYISRNLNSCSPPTSGARVQNSCWNGLKRPIFLPRLPAPNITVPVSMGW